MLKDEILGELLLGKAVSGEALAKKYGVSRSAVWKAVNALKSEGYEISGANRAGYTLNGADVLSPARILSNLDDYCAKYADNVRFRGVNVICLEETTSTNDEAKRLAARKDDCVIITAERQTAGRGRLGRSFYSPKKTGAYFTILLGGNRDFADALKFTSLAAVATARALYELTGVQLGIKWVNDLYLGGKKVCGILTEAVTDLESGGVSNIIIGIGVNMTTDDFPEGLETAGAIGAKGLPRSALIAGVAAEILKEVPYIAQNRHISYYREHSVVLNKNIIFTENGVSREGKAVAIGDGGELIVDCCGERKILSSGEISVKIK